MENHLNPKEKAENGAILETEEGDIFFMLPVAGGHSLKWGNRTLKVLSPAAPLGRKFLGKEAGDEVSFNSAEQEKTFVLRSVL